MRKRQVEEWNEWNEKEYGMQMSFIELKSIESAFKLWIIRILKVKVKVKMKVKIMIMITIERVLRKAKRKMKKSMHRYIRLYMTLLIDQN